MQNPAVGRVSSEFGKRAPIPGVTTTSFHAGLDIANPAGAIASAAMMLDELGLGDSGAVLREALEATLVSGCRTPDLGGDASTSSFGAAVREKLRVRARRDHGLRNLFMTDRGCCG